MTLYYGTNLSVGAPTLAGVNGSLITLLDYWLVTIAGWAKEYTSGTTGAVYRPAFGNRFRLFVLHDSATSGDARLALVRGCENASAATTAGIVDPFPTVAQAGNTLSNWRVSNTANATTRPYYIEVDSGSTGSMAFVRLAVDAVSGASANGVEIGWWADEDTNYPGDTYATSICIRNNANAAAMPSTSTLQLNASLAPAATQRIFFCRDASGAVKSAYAGVESVGGNINAPGMNNGLPGLQVGYNNTVNRVAVALNCTGSATTTPSNILSIYKRVFTPNLWQTAVNAAASSSGITPFDTFQDPAYNVGSNFLLFNLINQAAGNSGGLIFETTDTWTKPSG